jgi:hypothetical protein
MRSIPDPQQQVVPATQNINAKGICGRSCVAPTLQQPKHSCRHQFPNKISQAASDDQLRWESGCGDILVGRIVGTRNLAHASRLEKRGRGSMRAQDFRVPQRDGCSQSRRAASTRRVVFEGNQPRIYRSSDSVCAFESASLNISSDARH